MKIQVLTSFIIAMVLIGCHNQSTEPLSSKKSDLPTSEGRIVTSANSFGFDLFNKVNNSEPNKNVFISPFSVSMAFGMVLNGANGSTLDSLKKVLGDAGVSLDDINNSYKNISTTLTNLDPKVVFQIANSIWYREGFPVLQTFLDANKNYFEAEVSALDFNQPSAVQTINGWVNTKTHGKIPFILKDIPPGLMMCLINAIYFKGIWTYQFDSTNTADTTFTCADGSTSQCKMMKQRATFAYYEDADIQAIDLPYGDRSFSMTVILPSTGTSIDQYAASLTQAKWDGIIAKLDSAEVILSLPKFKLEYGRTLNSELITMGMGIAFSDYADFSRISQKVGLTISEVLHKTFVEVNEEGTEAAAVTAIIFVTTTAYPPVNHIHSMNVNHPFILAIREHTSGTILFIGKIVNPNS